MYFVLKREHPFSLSTDALFAGAPTEKSVSTCPQKVFWGVHFSYRHISAGNKW